LWWPPIREPPQDISAIQTIKSNAVMEIHHCINLIAPLPIIPNYLRAQWRRLNPF
jgi:hypothetical protein